LQKTHRSFPSRGKKTPSTRQGSPALLLLPRAEGLQDPTVPGVPPGWGPSERRAEPSRPHRRFSTGLTALQTAPVSSPGTYFSHSKIPSPVLQTHMGQNPQDRAQSVRLRCLASKSWVITKCPCNPEYLV